MTPPLFSCKDLSITFPQTGNRALSDVSFTLGNEKLAVVGESGSGKTLLGRAILGLLPGSAQLTAKEMAWEGRNMLSFSEKEFATLRGKEMGFVVQDPRYGLNPSMTVGAQVDEMFLYHCNMTKRQAKAATLEALARVKISEPKRVYEAYPHQTSGGMGQRAMIAMMLAASPRLLIADEPTSSLDRDNCQAFLDLLDDLRKEAPLALLFITHDLPLVERFADRCIILRNGHVVEIAPAQELRHSAHPYTQALLQCVPQAGIKRERLPTLKDFEVNP